MGDAPAGKQVAAGGGDGGGAAAVGGIAGKTAGRRRQPGMVLPATLKATARGFRREDVKLALRGTAGVDRAAEPVTSGVPLPAGAVRTVEWPLGTEKQKLFFLRRPEICSAIRFL